MDYRLISQSRDLGESLNPGDNDIEGGAYNNSTSMTVSGSLPFSSNRRSKAVDMPLTQMRTCTLVDKPGIPTPLKHRFPIFPACRWILVVTLMFGFLWVITAYLTEQIAIDLQAGTSLNVDATNCDLHVRELDSEFSADARLTIQYWDFLGKSEIKRQGSVELPQLSVRVQMSARIQVWRCLVTVAVKSGSELRELSGRLGGTDLSTVLFEAAPARAINIKLREVNFRANQLPENLTLAATGGIVELAPRRSMSAKVIVHAKDTLVVARTPGPMTLRLNGLANSESILSALHVERVSVDSENKTGDFVYDLAKTAGETANRVDVTVLATKSSPGYFLGGFQDSAVPQEHLNKMQTIRGVMQTRHQAFLTNKSEEKMKEITQWIHGISQTSSPWVLRVRVEGPGLPKGTWSVLSSQAFLALPLELFVVLSAGSLHPVLKETRVHMMSIKQQWPPHQQNDSILVSETHDEEDEDEAESGHCDAFLAMQWEMFHVLRPYLAKYSGAVAWVPDKGQQFVYTKKGAHWRAKPRNLATGQSIKFFIAIMLNFCASAILSSLALHFGREFFRNTKAFRDQDVATAASHRVAQQLQIKQAWHVMATQVDWPDHAVLLRWRKRTGIQRASYFTVYAQSDACWGTRLKELQEVMIENVKAEEVTDRPGAGHTRNSVIAELRFSISGTDTNFGYHATGKPLLYHHTYKFRIEGYSIDEELLSSSDWSNEVFISPVCSIFDYPLLLLKTFFPVPTSSLAYFLDHHAERGITGQIPQQIAVLSDIRVHYHKNFMEFKDCNKRFYVAAYMGETMMETQAETRRGRCVIFSKTMAFSPPDLCIKEEEMRTPEENKLNREDDERVARDEPPVNRRTILDQSQELRIGATKKGQRDIWVSLCLESNDEEVAEAKLDFEDLKEAFEEEKDNDADDQTFFFDLKTKDFDEEYLVWVQAKVDFRCSIDPRCEAMDRNRRLFFKDTPGQIFYEGMERTLTWDNESDLLKNFDKFDLYATFPDNPRLEDSPIAKGISKESIGITFMIEFPQDHDQNHVVFGHKLNHVVCEIRIAAKDHISEELVSHRFVICRTWTVGDFELAYASFCKMNGLVMEHLTSEVMEELKIATTAVQLKVVHDLRPPLPFEPISDTEEAIRCPGMLLITNNTIRGKNSATDQLESSTGGEGTDVETADSRERLPERHPFVRQPSPSDLALEGSRPKIDSALTVKTTNDMESKGVYRSTFKEVQTLEHIWPVRRYWTLNRLKYGTGWVPNSLLLYRFYIVDNILDGMDVLVDIIRIRFLFHALQNVVGDYRAQAVVKILIAPVTWVLPFICEMFLFFVQLLVFLCFPFVLLSLTLLWERLKDDMDELGALDAHDARLPDLAFGKSVSDRGWRVWLSDLAPGSKASLVCACVTVALELFLIFESSFLRGLVHSKLQRPIQYIYQGLADFVISTYVWMMLCLASMCFLWFTTAVVIYPEQIIAPLVCILGLVYLAHTEVIKYARTTAQIKMFLQAEVADVFAIVCENFLLDYDKANAGSIKTRERDRSKQERLVWENIGSYYNLRLHENARSKEAHDPLNFLSGSKSWMHVHRTFARALLKKKYWNKLNKSETECLEKPELQGLQAREHFDSLMDSGGLRTTKHILEDLGLPHDERVLSHFDIRFQILDRETEAGGEAVHLYNKEMRESLMKTYVRLLHENESPPKDVVDVLADPKALAQAIYQAHYAKTKLFDPEQGRRSSTKVSESSISAKIEGKQSLMELYVQDIHQQKFKKMYFNIAEQLDRVLDPQNIAAQATSFLDQRIPDEINKHLRLTLDEHYVGSSMQLLFERLRRWKGATTSQDLEDSLILEDEGWITKGSDSGSKNGLMKLLTNIGILSPDASKGYRKTLYEHVGRMVHKWSGEDASSNTGSVDSADIENFIRELVGDHVWWQALADLLIQIGFPMANPQSSASTPSRAGLLSVADVMKEFERASQRRDVARGLLPAESVLDFLRTITRADHSDPAAGRIWKAQMRLFMQSTDVGICGFVEGATQELRAVSENVEAQRDEEDEEEGFKKTKDGKPFDVLKKLAEKKWPDWLETIWEDIVPPWDSKGGQTGSPSAFLPKPKIQAFLQKVTFVKVERKKKEDLGLKPVDEVYDNFLRYTGDDQPSTLWKKQRSSYHQIRGCWHELFLALLSKMDSGVQDTSEGNALFERALQQCRDKRRIEGGDFTEGLIDFDFLDKHWFRDNFIAKTDECSLSVFIEVLRMAEITIPIQVIEQLWWAAEKVDCLHGSLRRISELEDRVIMYLSKGLCYESARSLIQDELGVPFLQNMKDAQVKTAFEQVDEKTGKVGFLEPREVNEMILALSLEGMSLAGVRKAFKRLKMELSDGDIKNAFLMVDTDGDDVIDMAEFLAMIDYLIGVVIPQDIFKKMGITGKQTIMRLAQYGVLGLSILLFVVIALGAFQVDISDASSQSTGYVRAGIALVAILGLRGDSGSEDEDIKHQTARESLYAIMGVTQSQVETRRRGGQAEPILQHGASSNKLKIKGFKSKKGEADDDDKKEDDDGGGDDP